MTSRQLVLRNLAVNYYFDEPETPADTAVVFLHGWRSTALIWQPIFAKLRGKFRLYALDLPGFGQSEVPRSALTLSDYVEVVAEFLRKLELPRACLVAHSFGGRVAIKLAATKPELVARLVLADSGGLRMSENRRKAVTALAKVLSPLFALPLLRNLRPRVYHMLGAEDYLATPELKATFLNIIHEEVTEYLPQVRVPTLIIWGEDDRETPLSDGQTMNGAIPGSNLVVFPKSGHFSFLDRPEEFSRELVKFFNEPR